jgi:hypothetical protein
MANYRQAPKYEQPLTVGGDTAAWWYRWFADTDVGTPPSSETKVALTVSPMSFVAPSKGYLIINGGSVSAVHIGRVSSHNTGQTQGFFPMSKNDYLIVTYTGTPTLTFFAQ